MARLGGSGVGRPVDPKWCILGAVPRNASRGGAEADNQEQRLGTRFGKQSYTAEHRGYILNDGFTGAKTGGSAKADELVNRALEGVVCGQSAGYVRCGGLCQRAAYDRACGEDEPAG